MKKKLVMLGMILAVSMNFAVGCNRATHLPETSKDVINTTTDRLKTEDTAINDTLHIEETDNESEIDEYVQRFLDSIGSNGYILDKSNTEKLTYDAIYAMGTKELDYARNEIYARHGYVFHSPQYNTYFTSKEWYNPVEDNSSITLNKLEQYNIALIEFTKELRERDYGGEFERVSEQNIYEANKEVHLDINGDGKDEVITYDTLGEDGEDIYKAMIHVNGDAVEVSGCLDTEFAIVDIDPNDTYKEILVSDFGLSDDYRTSYYIFKDNKITQIGETEGIFDFGIRINGDGTFIARTRTDFLHTWHYAKRHYLDQSHNIADIHDELYEDNTPVFLQESCAFYAEKDVSSDTFTLSEGQVVTLVASDLNEWVQIKTKGGKTGWLKLTDYNKLEDGKSIHQIFLGLFFYD